MFRVTLSVNSVEAAKRACGHLLRMSRASRKSARMEATEAGRLGGGSSLVHIVWDGKMTKRIIDGCKESHLCVCARTYAGRLKTEELVGLNKID